MSSSLIVFNDHFSSFICQCIDDTFFLPAKKTECKKDFSRYLKSDYDLKNLNSAFHLFLLVVPNSRMILLSASSFNRATPDVQIYLKFLSNINSQ